MVREIDLEQVALNLEAAVRDVRDRHNQLVVVHNGERVMAMIPVEFYDRWFAEAEPITRLRRTPPQSPSPLSDRAR